MKKQILLWMWVILTMLGCKKEKFIYESEWLTPLFKASLGVEDIVADSLIAKDTDQSLDLVVEYEETLDSLLDILEVPDSLTEVSISLTQLLLDDRKITDTITLVEMYPPAILLNGQTTTLDAQDITSDQGTEIDVTEEFFQTATFKEGFLDLSIYNDLPVDVELIEFELINKSDGSIIISDAFNDVLAFDSATKSYDLAGKTVEGIMEAKLKRVKTKASVGPVLIEAFKGLRLQLLVYGLKPESATAIFPAQSLINKEEETTYNFGGPQITAMRLSKGEVLMEVYSTIEEEIILEYEVPQSAHFVTGEKIYKEFRIPPAKDGVPSRTDERFPIGQYEIIYKGKDVNNPPFVNTFYSILDARMEYTGEVRSLSLSDSIYIKFGLVDVEPELAIGDFGKKTYTFTDPLDVPVFRDLEGSISLEDASLDVIFENSFGIEANIDIQSIQGVNSRTGKQLSLISPELQPTIFLRRGINLNTHVRPYSTGVNLNKTNSNFKLFLENIPDKILPDFDVTTRPNGSNNLTDFAFYDSYLKTKLRLHVPMHFGMDSFGLVKKKSFDLNEDLSNIKKGSLKLIVDNGFPWIAWVRLEFLDEDDQVLLNTLGTSDDVVDAGLIDPGTGKVGDPQRSNLIIDLSQEDLELVNTASKIRVYAFFSTPSNQRYDIFSDYKFDLQLISQFVYESN
ncbi:MAG: hypothetical protein JXR19_05525 [Bacteroidia bacterium]